MVARRPALEKIPEVCKQYPCIRAVYLFGSYATGQPNPNSDVDLAIVPADSTAREHMLDIMADLVRHVHDRIDLVFLDTPDVVLRFEAVRHNRLVYQTPDFDPGTYTSRIVREYWDFRPYLDAQRRAMKERMLANGSR